MKKKSITLVLVALVLMTCFTTIPAGSALSKKNAYPSSMQSSNVQLQSLELSDSSIEEILDSLTIRNVIESIIGHIQNKIQDSSYKTMMLRALEDGIQALERLGIASRMTLLEARDILASGIFNQGGAEYRSFLINILPTRATVSTLLPPYQINISNNPQYPALTVKLELFTKIIPFIDRIVTKQSGIIRPQLTQSATIWPAIGGRITVAGFTLGILAFGPRIKWTRG